MVQHMREDEDMDHDGVVWDAAPVKQAPGSLPPSDPTSDNVEDSTTDTAEVDSHLPTTQLMYKMCMLVVHIAEEGAQALR